MAARNGPRSPSAVRNLLEVRVRRLSQRISWQRRWEALTEIRDLAEEALQHMSRTPPEKRR